MIGRHCDIRFHFYADDNQLYVRLSNKEATSAFAKLNACHKDIQDGMLSCKLKLNPGKTEFIICGSKLQREKLKTCFPVNILGNLLHPTDCQKTLVSALTPGFPLLTMYVVSAGAALFKCGI